jgi:hypothetical protein
MSYCDVANGATVPNTNIINEIPCYDGTLRATGVWIQHQVTHRACADDPVTLDISSRPALKSHKLQNLTMLIDKSHSILNAPRSLQVLPGAPVNALAEFWDHCAMHQGGLGASASSWRDWRWLRWCLRGVYTSSGPNYILLIFAPCVRCCVSMNCCCATGEEDDNEKNWEVLWNI